MHVGQFPKDLESREINLLFVWGLKKASLSGKVYETQTSRLYYF